jgi:putative transcriptional regulator
MTTKKPDRLTREILDMADDQRRLGLMDDAAHRKITVRHLGPDALPTDRPISGDEIREIREGARMSQGAFARHLHTSTGYISKLERGAAAASGPALALLNVIRRKGIDVLL